MRESLVFITLGMLPMSVIIITPLHRIREGHPMIAVAPMPIELKFLTAATPITTIIIGAITINHLTKRIMAAIHTQAIAREVEVHQSENIPPVDVRSIVTQPRLISN